MCHRPAHDTSLRATEHSSISAECLYHLQLVELEVGRLCQLSGKQTRPGNGSGLLRCASSACELRSPFAHQLHISHYALACRKLFTRHCDILVFRKLPGSFPVQSASTAQGIHVLDGQAPLSLSMHGTRQNAYACADERVGAPVCTRGVHTPSRHSKI